MESYHHHYLPLHIANLEAETAAVRTGATTEAPIRVLETRVVRAPETTLQGYILQLETLLGRRWDEDDLIQTRDGLAAVSSRGFSLEDVVESRLIRLRGQIQEPERLAATLLGYYRLFYAALPAATEVSSVRIQRAPMWEITEDSWEMWTEIEMEMEMEMAAENSMREMDEGSSRTPYEEEIVVEQLKKLKTREFDGEDERHEDEEETCSVCLEDLYRGMVTALECRHEFHFDCLRRWLLGGRNVCPLCRARAIAIRVSGYDFRALCKRTTINRGPWVQPLTEKAAFLVRMTSAAAKGEGRGLPRVSVKLLNRLGLQIQIQIKIKIKIKRRAFGKSCLTRV